MVVPEDTLGDKHFFARGPSEVTHSCLTWNPPGDFATTATVYGYAPNHLVFEGLHTSRKFDQPNLAGLLGGDEKRKIRNAAVTVYNQPRIPLYRNIEILDQL